ncbi:MAG TPA: hypothetical protein VMI56_08085 [Reyranella sp.]|nr:hypothetical protein [Reyranella sp.]
MGLFRTPDQSNPYLPPIGEAGGPPTMLGRTSADETPGNWRIEMRYLPILHRGHAFLALVGPDGDEKQLHGRSQSINTGKIVSMGMDNAKLVSPADNDKDCWMTRNTIPIGRVATGSRAEMEAIWARGKQAADEVNRRNLDYKADDLSYELGGNGGQIQNSNAFNYTIGKAMGLDLTGAVQSAGLNRVFPGWGRDLLDPAYKPYVTPPDRSPNFPP